MDKLGDKLQRLGNVLGSKTLSSMGTRMTSLAQNFTKLGLGTLATTVAIGGAAVAIGYTIKKIKDFGDGLNNRLVRLFASQSAAKAYGVDPQKQEAFGSTFARYQGAIKNKEDLERNIAKGENEYLEMVNSYERRREGMRNGFGVQEWVSWQTKLHNLGVHVDSQKTQSFEQLLSEVYRAWSSEKEQGRKNEIAESAGINVKYLYGIQQMAKQAKEASKLSEDATSQQEVDFVLTEGFKSMPGNSLKPIQENAEKEQIFKEALARRELRADTKELDSTVGELAREFSNVLGTSITATKTKMGEILFGNSQGDIVGGYKLVNGKYEYDGEARFPTEVDNRREELSKQAVITENLAQEVARDAGYNGKSLEELQSIRSYLQKDVSKILKEVGSSVEADTKKRLVQIIEEEIKEKKPPKFDKELNLLPPTKEEEEEAAKFAEALMGTISKPLEKPSDNNPNNIGKIPKNENPIDGQKMFGEESPPLKPEISVSPDMWKAIYRKNGVEGVKREGEEKSDETKEPTVTVSKVVINAQEVDAESFKREFPAQMMAAVAAIRDRTDV